MTYHSNRLNIAKEEIKARLDLQQVIEQLTGQTFVRGAIKCPFHNEKTASFRINGGYYKCFGCGASGDILSFTMHYNGLSFTDAIKWLDSTYSLGLLGQKVTVRQQAEARKRKREAEAQELEEHKKRLEYDEICTHYRICNEALRPGVLEPFSDIWCYYANQRTYLDYLIQEGGY